MPPKAKKEEVEEQVGPKKYDDYFKQVDAVREEIKKKQKEQVDTFTKAETRELFVRGLPLKKEEEAKFDSEEWAKIWDKIPKVKQKEGEKAAAAAPAKGGKGGKDASPDDGMIVTQENAMKAVIKKAQTMELCEIPPPTLDEMLALEDPVAEKFEGEI